MKLPFGKFKGTEIEECPSSYLDWLAVNCDWNDKVQQEADDEYQHREHYNTHFEED